MKNRIENIKTGLSNMLAAIVNRGPIGWVRRLFSVVKSYHNNMQIMARAIDDAVNVTKQIERYVKRATKVHVDVSGSATSPSTVIVCGQYRGRDYVRAFPIVHDNVEHIVRWLTDVSKQAQVGRLDMPLEIDATVRRELQDRGAL